VNTGQIDTVYAPVGDWYQNFPRSRSAPLKLNITSKNPVLHKRKLAKIASILATIRAHFPDIEEVFTASLKAHYPEMFTLAVENGIIPGVHAMPTEIPGCTRIACDHRPLIAHGVKEIPGINDH